VIAGWSSLSRAERDAAYNNSQAVANSPELVERRNAASAAFRKAHPAGLDVPYGPAPRQKWDLFAAADSSAPCLVFIHGGYWQRNAREDFACFAEGIMSHGWSMALPGYTLAPSASLGAIVGEIGRALDWLAAHGPEHGVAAGPVIVSGWSAGGHLTAMALSHRRVAAGLAISGVYELAPIRETYLNDALHLTDAEVATLSPLRLPVVQKPLAIAYGTKELQALVDDSRDLHARRQAAHAAGPLIPVDGTDHFTIMEELRKPDGVLVRGARELLGSTA
jgi:acetyl esterase/lipase